MVGRQTGKAVMNVAIRRQSGDGSFKGIVGSNAIRGTHPGGIGVDEAIDVREDRVREQRVPTGHQFIRSPGKAASAAALASRGSRTVNAVPACASDSTLAVPPCAIAISRTM